MPSNAQLLQIIHIQTEIAQLGLDLGGMMSLLVQRMPALIGADGAAIELAEGEDMVYQSASGIAQGQIGLRLKRANSLSGLCVKTGQAQRCDDSDLDPRVDREACRRMGLRSMIVIPLRHRGETIGVLKAMSAQPAKFLDSDMVLLGLMSDLAGAAIYFATQYSHDNLFNLATHDGLTNLANRSLFMDRLRNAITRSARDLQQIAVLVIDMDGLKGINDTYGHRTGDAILQEFGRRLMTAARLSDTVARLGGDEFAVVLMPVDAPDGVDAAVQRFLAAIATPFTFEGKTHHLQASIGAARFPCDANEVNQLIDLADQRMYAVKQQHYRQRPAALH